MAVWAADHISFLCQLHEQLSSSFRHLSLPGSSLLLLPVALHHMACRLPVIATVPVPVAGIGRLCCSYCSVLSL